VVALTTDCRTYGTGQIEVIHGIYYPQRSNAHFAGRDQYHAFRGRGPGAPHYLHADGPILESGIEVDLPKTHTVKAISDEKVVVTIDKQSELFMSATIR
jgi:hypothetical protein